MEKRTYKDISAVEHREYFAEFCAKIQRVGGATPHLSMVVNACPGVGRLESLWRGGCYAAVYNFAGAELLWQSWRFYQVVDRPGEFHGWVERNWQYIPLRKERKAVNNVMRFTESVISMAEWVIAQEGAILPTSYSELWEDFLQVKYMGRYIAIRYLEFLRRTVPYLNEIAMPDIRPADAIYPRQSLALMYPDYREELYGNNSRNNIETTNTVATHLKEYVTEAGVEIDYYTLQSLLCEYKQSVKGRRQYPGRSVDSELKFKTKVSEFGEYNSQFYDIRRAIFPIESLGEIQGWNDARNDLGKVLTDYGYTWSDMDYDYMASKSDLANPVARNNYEVA